MKITAYNPPTENLEKTFLTNAYAAGATTTVVKNNDGFSDNAIVQIGESGYERTEITDINGSVSAGTALTFTATTFSHDEGDPVYILSYNQIKFYRSTTGVDGTYTSLATVAIDADNKNEQTSYDDTAGTVAYFYKTSFYNSVADLESQLSDPIAGSGYARQAVGRYVTEVAREVGDTEFNFITPTEWLGIANECSDDLQTRVKKPYRFLHTSETLSTVAGQNYIDLSGTTGDVWKYDFMQYEYATGSTNSLYRVLPLEEFLYRYNATDATDSDDLQVIALDESTNRILLYPAPETSQTDVAKVWYYKKFNYLESMGDLLETPTGRVYKMFMKAHYYGVKAIKDRAFLNLADRFESKYESEAIRIPRASRLDVGTPKGFKFLPQTFKGLRKN